ncbi:MAG: hypothetical protein K5798_09235 [Nitrosopumilus sp.]|nr:MULTISPECIES: hypothetical protein [Nitrosopumilus]MCV0367425.1 hypothetical protein [Nitrosopumilus sp.]BDQ31038.1 hypothetical protein NZOSNM25_001148 [Nitrosopumilus zosterae]
MKTTIFPEKNTKRQSSKGNFLENQILKFKASKNKVFILTAIATIMVVVK